MNRPILALIVAAMLAVAARAADWPQHRADAARSGYTAERLPDGLSPRWTHRAAHRPMSAWPSRNRLRFDRAFQPVVADGSLYFGSSADGKLYALHAATGERRWTFQSDGPLRFAPAAWRDRVLLAGDDGHLYCLAADDGRLLWKLRGGPRSEMLLGSDRMISRWPARGGPVVVDGTVYFAAGIWPSEGVYVYAVDVASGDVLWCNDSSGGLEMDQPHSTARAKSGIAAQGYLAVGRDALLVPTGRAVPAVLGRSDGSLRYFQLQPNQHLGGADVAVVDDHFFNGGAMFALDGGGLLGRPGVEVAAHPRFLIASDDGKILAFDRRKLVVDKEVVDRKGKKRMTKALAPAAWTLAARFDADSVPAEAEETKTPENVMGGTAWSRPHLSGAASGLIVAGDKIVAGGWERVSLIDVGSREVSETASVEGRACGLAVAGGRLFVSTDQGTIHCFASGRLEAGETPEPATSTAEPHGPEDDADSVYARAADEIVRRSGVVGGYCLDLACGDGRLALELARRTKLQIYAVDSDPANVQAARRRFDAAGIYGVRVTVHHTEPGRLPYPNHFADLVVSGRAVTEGPGAAPRESIGRVLCPGSGVVCMGRPGSMEASRRKPLEGGGEWTHQNCSPANTLSSDDALVRGPLEMLWFRDVDFVMASRHGRAPGPLVQGGRMFVEGINGLRAQNIYNGRPLWEFSLPGVLLPYHREHSIGAAWTGGNYCVEGDRVYVHDGGRCLALDAATGRNVAQFEPPKLPSGKPGTWGYVACAGGMLFGSLVDEEYLVKCWSDRWDTGGLFTESRLLFALDAETGKLGWTYAPKHSIRHNTIAMGGGRVYLIDRPPAPLDDIRARKETGPLSQHVPGRLVALDRATGKPLWKGEEDAFGTLLVYSAEHDVLLVAYQAAHQASRDSERGDRMAAFRAADGAPLWDVEAQYADRPVLADRTIYAPPGAWDLLTGKRLEFELERSYGCGIVAGSRRTLLFRSATLAYRNLEGPSRTENYGGIRPGCWIAAIPAGGLVLMADAASWCTCSYLNQASVALQPATRPND